VCPPRRSGAEWKLLNLSFEHELPLYSHLLAPVLRAVPAAHEIAPEAARLLDLLAPFHPMPPEHVPSTSFLRTFIGGAWLTPA
jgi:hypothetical protein